MSIPTTTLTNIKDLLYIEHTLRDSDIETLYKRELTKVCLEYGWLVEVEILTTTIGKSIYTTQNRCMRVLGALYNNIQVKKILAESQDNLLPSWQNDTTGFPQFWWSNQIPPSLDSLVTITPDNIALHPAPNLATSLTLFEVVYPSNDDPVLLWIHPYLVYRVAGAALREIGEEYEGEEIKGQTDSLIDFYEAIASLWKAIYEQRVP